MVCEGDSDVILELPITDRTTERFFEKGAQDRGRVFFVSALVASPEEPAGPGLLRQIVPAFFHLARTDKGHAMNIESRAHLPPHRLDDPCEPVSLEHGIFCAGILDPRIFEVELIAFHQFLDPTPGIRGGSSAIKSSHFEPRRVDLGGSEKGLPDLLV